MLTTLNGSVPSMPRFDEHGRCEPLNLIGPANLRVRRRFICNQPIVDYVAIHQRLVTHLGCGDVIPVAEFQFRAEGILQGLRADERITGLSNAVYLPFFLPQVRDGFERDIGEDIEKIYLPGVERSFTSMFPGQRFTNHHKTGLVGKLHVAPGSRHERLLQGMRDRVTVGVMFVSLTEYSIPAALEQTARLPEHVMLTGGADLCAALIGSPQLLLRSDGYPPLIWLAGLSGESALAGYHFEAYGHDLTFNRRVHFDQVAEYWASALTITAADDQQ